jgi:hypothetical protein
VDKLPALSISIPLVPEVNLRNEMKQQGKLSLGGFTIQSSLFSLLK